MIEYKQTDSSNRSFIEWNNKLHLEHILPKEYKKFPEWKHITVEVKEKFLHSIATYVGKTTLTKIFFHHSFITERYSLRTNNLFFFMSFAGN